ncbi:hypothetical protein [Paracoccus aminovorans]|uniref:hypothetical protein n=1 Tax=Paracoccus aminovorans TaxID=34004 RepID=UPI002B25A590|nr:hypothetical protein [Paracoccus aminovorans]
MGHQALARALTPAAIAEWPGAHENALDQAAGILAELGVMPVEEQVKVHLAEVAERWSAGFASDVEEFMELRHRQFAAGFRAGMARAERAA